MQLGATRIMDIATGMRRKRGVPPVPARALPMDSASIRDRLERRPLPQIPPGPLTRAVVASPALQAARLRREAPVLELVSEIATDDVFELTEEMARA